MMDYFEVQMDKLVHWTEVRELGVNHYNFKFDKGHKIFQKNRDKIDKIAGDICVFDDGIMCSARKYETVLCHIGNRYLAKIVPYIYDEMLERSTRVITKDRNESILSKVGLKQKWSLFDIFHKQKTEHIISSESDTQTKNHLETCKICKQHTLIS